MADVERDRWNYGAYNYLKREERDEKNQLTFHSFDSNIVYDSHFHRLQYLDKDAVRMREQIVARIQALQDGENSNENPAEEENKPMIPEEVKPIVLRGASKTMDKLYAPSYNFHETRYILLKHRRNRAMLGIDRESVPRLSSSRGDKIKGRFAHHALQLGSMVDAHVNAIINNKVILGDTTWAVNERLPELLRTVGGMHRSNRTLMHVHPIAQTFLIAMLEKGWRPLRAQVPVGLIDQRLATLIDSIWVHVRTGYVAIIEMKKYESLYFRASNDWMAEPYHDKRNSPLNRFMVYLGWANRMFAETFGEEPDLSFIVRVSSKGVEFCCLELDNWVLEPERVAIAERRNYDFVHRLDIFDQKEDQLREERRRRAEAEAKAIEEKKRADREEEKARRRAEREAEKEANDPDNIEIRRQREEEKKVRAAQNAGRAERAANRKRRRGDDDDAGDDGEFVPEGEGEARCAAPPPPPPRPRSRQGTSRRTRARVDTAAAVAAAAEGARDDDDKAPKQQQRQRRRGSAPAPRMLSTDMDAA